MEEKSNLYIISIVAVVAIVGMVILVMSSGNNSGVVLVSSDYIAEDATTQDVAGAAIAVIGSDGWTQWFNRDSPSGKGDYETITDIRATYTNMCTRPTAVECQTAAGADYRTTKQKVTCDTTAGFYCLNSLNNGSEYKVTCKDYRVRYKCPISPGTVPKCNDTDGGYNIYVYGTVKAGSSGAYDCCSDATHGCLGSNNTGNYLFEHSCLNGAIVTNQTICLNGCSNGACRR